MCFYPQYIKGNYYACGKCIECKMKRAKEWSFRIMQEASLYNENCMITLTYNNENLPFGEKLNKVDLQLFMKRLRRKLEPKKIRFFACGEYGDVKGRPHMHVIIFGWYPKDAYFFKVDKKGNKLFRSCELEKIWTFGFSSIVELSLKTARYVAIYMQKPPTNEHPKPFLLMSRCPAIGFNAVDESVLKTDKIYVHGEYIRTPRIYVDKFEKLGVDLTEFKKRRKRINDDIVKNYSLNLYDIQERRKRFYDKFPHFIPKENDNLYHIHKNVCVYEPFDIDKLILQKNESQKIIDDLFDFLNEREKIRENFIKSLDNGEILDYNEYKKKK